MAKKTDTTPAERAPYIANLIHAAGPAAVQELLEAGISNIAGGSEGALALAAKLESAIATDTPAKYDKGDQVKVGDGVTANGFFAGTVESRYLNEDGEWEYQVRFNGNRGRYSEGVRESALTA